MELIVASYDHKSREDNILFSINSNAFIKYVDYPMKKES